MTLSFTAIDFLAVIVTTLLNKVTFITAVPASQCIRCQETLRLGAIDSRRCGKYRNEGALYCGQFHPVVCGKEHPCTVPRLEDK